MLLVALPSTSGASQTAHNSLSWTEQSLENRGNESSLEIEAVQLKCSVTIGMWLWDLADDWGRLKKLELIHMSSWGRTLKAHYWKNTSNIEVSINAVNEMIEVKHLDITVII